MNKLLEIIEKSFETDINIKNEFRSFIDNNQNNFNSRDNKIGHITCSMLVLNEDMDSVLLTHHKKFNMWLQLGGHWDDMNEDALKTALRETSEEGYGENRIVCDVFLDKNPIDLDFHAVKDKNGDHIHFDICFASIVKNEYKVSISHESHDVKWFNINNILKGNEKLNDNFMDSRLKRLLDKVKRIKKDTVSIEVNLKQNKFSI